MQTLIIKEIIVTEKADIYLHYFLHLALSICLISLKLLICKLLLTGENTHRKFAREQCSLTDISHLD